MNNERKGKHFFSYYNIYRDFFVILCRFAYKTTSGCSAVRLAHLLWEQGVVGSNPATPTKSKRTVIDANKRCKDGLKAIFAALVPILE